MSRVFIALRPPRAVREALLATCGGVVGARWQADDQLHLTLRFVGEVGARAADELIERISRVSSEPFELRIRGAGHFERRGRTSSLWAGIATSSALVTLQREVERACRAAGCPAEARKFVPHVTLARLGAAAAGAGEWLARHGDLAAPLWPVSSFRLYESRLAASGSRYTAIAEWPLGQSPTDR